MRHHGRDNFYVVGEGIHTRGPKGEWLVEPPSTLAELRKFRFSRLGPKGPQTDEGFRLKLAAAMTPSGNDPDSLPGVPAGFTYLAQFVDHDLTMDRTAISLGDNVTVKELIQGRSPALDLDSLYGRGPRHPDDAKFYSDEAHLAMGTTTPVPGDPITNQKLVGFDLPRMTEGATRAERRAPRIPDVRNDENLAVAQTHLAFIRFHNRVVDKVAAEGPALGSLFQRARRRVVRHYQWMLRHDFLPRVVDAGILDDVFSHGRRCFESNPGSQFAPTMPVEFSVAAYRLGHSMVRGAYQWNRIFQAGGPALGTLELLFQFSGTSGNFTAGTDPNDPEIGTNETLPTNWIADFRRLYDFADAGRPDLKPKPNEFNITKRIDTLLVNPLAKIPLGSFGSRGSAPLPPQLNLAFRNLTRASMMQLATGQQMAALLRVPKPLTEKQLLDGDGGAVASTLDASEKETLAKNTPLWFYILREAELNQGRLTGVGGRLVAEVFHRAMESSDHSILREPHWRPSLGPDAKTFRMVDLLLFAFEGKAELLNPLGPTP